MLRGLAVGLLRQHAPLLVPLGVWFQLMEPGDQEVLVTTLLD